jgi:CubicO group peptidase (beta-lactamase class C family)
MSEATRRRFLAGVGGAVAAGAGLTSVGATATTAASEPPTTRVSGATQPSFADGDEFEAAVDRVLGSRIGDATPGMTVSVVEGDDLILAKGYGYADRESGEPVHVDETTFAVGSVSKAVTFTGVMQAVEDGLLGLDADIETYLDGSRVTVPATHEDPITLGHLGTHTAGYESLVPRFFGGTDRLTDLETALVDMDPDRVRPSGETVEYSNYGATLAGYLIGRARGSSFDEAMRAELFDPLGMDTATFAQPVPEAHPGTPARPHELAGDTFVPTDAGYVNERPAGALSATATDLAAFMRVHLGDDGGLGAVDGTRVLDAASVARMHDVHHVRHPAVNNWRYGLYEAGPVGAGMLAHSGGTPTAASQLVLLPDRGIGVFVAYNTAPETNVLFEDIRRLLREFDLVPGPADRAPTDVAGRQERARAVAGEYSPTFMYDSGPAQVLERLGRLSVSAAGPGRLTTRSLSARFGDGVEWVEVEPYVYREVGGSDVLAAEVADGRVQQLHLSSIAVGAYEPVPLRESRLVTAGVVGGALAGFGLSLAGRGADRAWRRVTGGSGEGSQTVRPATVEHPEVDE